MIRLLLPILISASLLAECTPQQEQKALHIWKRTLHLQNPTNKVNQLMDAQNLCPLDIIVIDKMIVLAEYDKLSKEQIKQLARDNDAWDTEGRKGYRNHKINNTKKINKLLNITSPIPNATEHIKAIATIGGRYNADLLFDYDKYSIKNPILVQEICRVIHDEINKDGDALFGLEGGASSDGDKKYNQTLSSNRAKALEREILAQYPNYKKNLKIFPLGESQLVCKGGLLPEPDEFGEFQCITAEDKKASRRVAIRRVR